MRDAAQKWVQQVTVWEATEVAAVSLASTLDSEAGVAGNCLQ